MQMRKRHLVNLHVYASQKVKKENTARNTNMFAWLGLRYTRFAVTICPALLKSLSVGALLAGIARYRRTYCDRRWKSFSWNFHHWSGSSSPSILGNCKYRAISFATRSRGDWAGDGDCLIFLILVREPRVFLAFLLGGGWLLGSSTVSSGILRKTASFRRVSLTASNSHTVSTRH